MEESYIGPEVMGSYQTQPYQATYMKGEINLTIRGESKEQVMKDLKDMMSDWQNYVGNIGTQSVQPPAQTGIKCPVCGSGTHTKIVNTKNGEKQVYECDNTNCKTSKDYTTGVYIPGKYRTTIWPTK